MHPKHGFGQTLVEKTKNGNDHLILRAHTELTRLQTRQGSKHTQPPIKENTQHGSRPTRSG